MASQIHDTSTRVFHTIREYYKTDKYLGGLIKVNRLVLTEKLGTKVSILYDALQEDDEVYVNGVRYLPATRRNHK